MFADLENRFAITENRIDFFNNFCKSSAFKEQDVKRRMLWPVTEQILFRRMSMKIKIKLESSLVLLLEACCELI